MPGIRPATSALNVIHCTIAHALEKTKYLFSDLFWQRMETDYNFSLQFTADMLSMNKADFIITRTYQEIFGTDDTMGQHESYQFFTLPGLYQVVNGINLYAPKFNVIRPGVDETLYFPFDKKDNRLAHKAKTWTRRLFHDESEAIVGRPAHTAKRPIFTMARLDRIKNITGLIEAFGMRSILRQHCNLILAAGTTQLKDSKDDEERAAGFCSIRANRPSSQAAWRNLSWNTSKIPATGMKYPKTACAGYRNTSPGNNTATR